MEAERMLGLFFRDLRPLKDDARQAIATHGASPTAETAEVVRASLERLEDQARVSGCAIQSHWLKLCRFGQHHRMAKLVDVLDDYEWRTPWYIALAPLRIVARILGVIVRLAR